MRKRVAGIVRPFSPELRRKILAQHDDLLGIPLLLFGCRVVAEAWVRSYRDQCRREGRKYNRRQAVEKAAALVGLDADTLAN